MTFNEKYSVIILAFCMYAGLVASPPLRDGRRVSFLLHIKHKTVPGHVELVVEAWDDKDGKTLKGR